jgi:hypothetical protein
MHPSVPAGELFDFDAEVEPLLEVLVGKVLEQALMEVLEEEEIAALQQHQAHFEAIRCAWGCFPGLCSCNSLRGLQDQLWMVAVVTF